MEFMIFLFLLIIVILLGFIFYELEHLLDNSLEIAKSITQINRRGIRKGRK